MALLKRKKVAGATVEDEPNRSASIKFNERQMRIQAAGMEPFFDDRVSKMAMVIRKSIKWQQALPA